MLKRRQKNKTAEKIEENVQLVGFSVGEELYAIDIHTIQEIDRLHAVTRLPKALPFIEGVINMRDRIIPVIDMAKRFGRPQVEPGRHTRIMIVRIEGQSVGLIVERVTEVIEIAPSSIEPPPPMAFAVDQKYVSGVGRSGEALIIILDVALLLSAEEMNQLQVYPLEGPTEKKEGPK